MEVIQTTLIIYAALCLGFTVILTAKLEITVHKTNYTAVSGRNVTLECIVNANDVNITSIEWWYRVNQKWFQAPKSAKYVWTIQNPSLIISDVQNWDSAFYRCRALAHLDIAVGPDILLNVQNLPEVIAQDTQLFLTVGEDIALKCNVNGRGVPIKYVTWYRRSSSLLIPLTNETKYEWKQLGPDASIIIKKGTENDAGIYVCEGTTEVGSSNGNDIELRVGYKPTVTVNEYNYSIGMGDNLTLHCSIDGHGSRVKRVEWLKERNSQFRYLEQSTRVFWDISSPSMKINMVKLNDAGRYKCYGETDFGWTTSLKISVQIFYLPEVIVQQTQLFVTVGEDIALNCSVYGRGFPIKYVTWYRRSSSSLIPLTNETKYEWRRLGPDASIIIKQCTENDAGIYVCEGTTEVGSSKGNAIELIVGYKPTVTVNEYNYSIGMGDNLTLHCSIDGHGSTVKRVDWLKERNSQFRYLRLTTRVFWDDSSPSMKINMVKLDDAGRYKCYGETDFGSTTSSQISVQVFSKPIINITVNEYKTKNGTPAVLKVRIDDRVQTSLSVQWEKYEEENQQWFPLENNSRLLWTDAEPSLKLATVLVEDDGKYRVIGKTAYHEVTSSNITLIIYIPVKIKELETRPVFIHQGDTVEIRCLVDGRPEPKVKWKLANGTTIVSSSLKNMEENILILENVTHLNEGNYTCIAHNSFNTDESLITLTVSDLPLSNPSNDNLTGSSLEKYVVPSVSVFVCVALIAMIVVVILIRRKRQKGRTDKPDLEIRSTNGQKDPSPSENFQSGNNHSKFYVDLSGNTTYAQVIRKSSKIIDGNKSIMDTNIPQSDTHIDGNKSIRDTDASQVYMNINNAYAAVQQRSSTSNSDSCIKEETKSENTQVNKTEELNYVELEFSANAQDENSSLGIRGSPSDTTYTEVVFTH